MQATAESTGAAASVTNADELRPVRLLVPTIRRSDYWLASDDTRHASSLGITRHTTDADLIDLADRAAQIDAYADDPVAHLRRLRDALRQPRDIAEAREWGYIVPQDENSEEFNPLPRKRLGWWWVYDPERVETRAERRARYRSDERLVDMKGFARTISRAYGTTKDKKNESVSIRQCLADPEYRRELAVAQLAEHPSASTVEEVMEDLLAKAQTDVLTAMPERRLRGGSSDLWYVRDAVDYGRAMTHVNEWYERNTIKQTGRPKGSKTRNRRPKTASDASQTE